jgi:Type IV secretion-system coupling protein DNA-binding domain
MDTSPLFFGRVDFRNDHRIFGILHDDRRFHCHIIGKTGTGKSALLKHFIAHDLRSNHGLTLIDPHSDLVSSGLDYVSTYRTRDVIYFNPADQDYPVGLNILEAVPRERRFLVASHVVSAFHNLWNDSWGPRLEYLLLNCVLTLLDIDNSTLLGIPRLLSDKAYRHRVLPFIEDSIVQKFWIEEYERYPAVFQKQVVAPLQDKVGQFLSSYPMRNIVGQPHSTFSMEEVIDQRQVLLCNFAKGAIGEANATLLGALVTTKLFLTALARQSLPEPERTDHYLYLDECQDFTQVD